MELTEAQVQYLFFQIIRHEWTIEDIDIMSYWFASVGD